MDAISKFLPNGMNQMHNTDMERKMTFTKYEIML